MTDPSAADHLAELDARYAGHLAALRRHAEQLTDDAETNATALDEKVLAAAPAVPPPSAPRAGSSLPPAGDAPLADGLALDDDAPLDDLPSFDDL